MAQGRQNKGSQGKGASRDDGGKPESVENLIKPRKQASPDPHSGQVEQRNIKRGNGGGGQGTRGGISPWVGVGLSIAVVTGGVVWVAGEMSELDRRLAAVPSIEGNGGSGDTRGVPGEIAVLEERIVSLEKEISKLDSVAVEPAVAAEGQDVLLKRLEKRLELARLADEAIASGFRSVLRKIDSAVDEAGDEELQQCANAEKARVEIYYLNGAGFFPLPLPEEQDGVPVLEIGTDRLSEYLLVAESPGPLRARAAQLLGRRMETLSADALSESLMLEPDLRVLVHATASFRRVTGCPIPSVFGGPQMREWLTGNRELVVARFKDIAEKQAAAREK